MQETEQIAECLDALGNPTRLDLFRLLVRAGGEGRTVGQIQEALAIPASTLSHHLKLLELVGLVSRGKQGTTHMVSANIPKMDELVLFLTKECCADRPESDHKSHWHKD
ncbi:ArsR/SmtB family transcription factor [Curvivirga aplysinae]|uniref:ArsR/SmtB family transcription factor n=1 Tax=Curvivirga aplysinae TaxID=2529852 RepID=UPI0012BBC886|nr:metalloregulator ArsR/SmtB family transcription factor [Curvivirga aplysinae]MTI09985.1 ArsR family transcriptional regulator [Curvivirga aplysinae]